MKKNKVVDGLVILFAIISFLFLLFTILMFSNGFRGQGFMGVLNFGIWGFNAIFRYRINKNKKIQRNNLIA